ncbi:MAG: lipopolysaccharide biosynthesis protein [Gammaproteobacteria bacterium]|nr:lipopolysaccharide biosynthesis protein [Gammaproteobacteria bacterium]
MNDLNRKVAFGMAWMAGARVAVRALGLVSTLVLARLLVPADFGIIAMATSIAAGLELLTLFGFDMALIQRKTLTRDDYDSAWTLNTMLGIGMATLLVLGAGAGAAFYREPRLEPVIMLLAIQYAVKNAANPGTVDFRRNLDFRWEFVSQVIPKLGGVVITIPLALWLRDYRALIAGMILTTVVSCIMSYTVHPHRPRPCLKGAGELFRFSRWLLINNLITFFRNRGSTFIIGRIMGTASLGIYGLAYEVSNMPTTEMVAPINRVLGPTYVKVRDNPDVLRSTFRSTFGLITILILPVSIGLAAVADPLVRVVLGDKWLATIPLISLLAFSGAGNLMQTNTGSVHTAIGQPRYITLTGMIHVLTLLPAIIIGTHQFGLIGAAGAYALHTWILGIWTTYAILFRTTVIRREDVLAPCWRPICGSVVMYLLVRGFLWLYPGHGSTAQALLALVAATLIGLVAYVSVVLGLWVLAGRPDGSETSLLWRFRKLVTRLRPGRRPGKPG